MSIELVMPSNHLTFCHPPLLLPSIFPSIRVFSSESVLCIRWPKHQSFSFSISPSKEYSGLISFRIDWFDLLAVQGTLKSLLQHHSSKASILQHSTFFMVQLSHPCICLCHLQFLSSESYSFQTINFLRASFCQRNLKLVPQWSVRRISRPPNSHHRKRAAKTVQSPKGTSFMMHTSYGPWRTIHRRSSSKVTSRSHRGQGQGGAFHGAELGQRHTCCQGRTSMSSMCNITRVILRPLRVASHSFLFKMGLFTVITLFSLHYSLGSA